MGSAVCCACLGTVWGACSCRGGLEGGVVLASQLEEQLARWLGNQQVEGPGATGVSAEGSIVRTEKHPHEHRQAQVGSVFRELGV